MPEVSKQTNFIPLHVVGEIIKDHYEIHEIIRHRDGKHSYLCERASDKTMVLVECLSLCNTIPPNRPDIFQQSKLELLESRAKADSSICESFELHINGDTVFYAVTNVPEKSEVVGPPSLQHTEGYFEPLLPTEARGIPRGVYRRGLCHLEIDILGLENTCCMSVQRLAMVLILATPLIPFFTAGLGTGILALWVIPLALYILVVGLLTYLFVKSSFGHTNFVITAQSFRQQEVLELVPRFGDSLNRPSAVEAKLSVIDRLFFCPLEGKTASLKEAKVENSRFCEARHGTKLVLVEYSGRTHSLRINIPLVQQAWLAREINEVLENIRDRTEIV